MKKRRLFGIRKGLAGHSVVLHISILLFILILVPSVPAQDMMYRYDAGHTGDYSQIAGGTGNNVSLIWSKMMKDQGNFFPAGGVTTPAIANGMVYVTGVHGELSALDVTTGRERWNVSIFVYRSSPAVANGIVYVGSNNGNVYALDAVTGKTIWAYNTRGPVDTSPTVANGILYITGSADGGSPQPNQTLYALNATTGKPIWNSTISSSSDTSPCVTDGAVFVRGDGGQIYAFSENSGNEIWNVSAGGGNNKLREPPSPLVKNGILYIGSNDGDGINTTLVFSIHAINSSTGSQLWTFTWEGQIAADPAISRNTLYVSSDNILYSLNATTGVQEWNTPLSGTRLIVANGRLYFCGQNGIEALDVASKTRFHVWDFPDNDNLGRSITFANGDGILYVEKFTNSEGNPGGFAPSYENTIYALDLNAETSGVPIFALTPAPIVTPVTTAAPLNEGTAGSSLPAQTIIVALGSVLLTAVVMVFIFRKRWQH
jgi:eukaryotic-like serine/threonine-protein kinase